MKISRTVNAGRNPAECPQRMTGTGFTGAQRFCRSRRYLCLCFRKAEERQTHAKNTADYLFHNYPPTIHLKLFDKMGTDRH